MPIVYFLLSGLMMPTHIDEAGQEHVLSFAMEDFWETDYSAFLHRWQASMGLQCLEDTEVLRLSLGGYQEICSRVPKMEHFFLVKANGDMLPHSSAFFPSRLRMQRQDINGFLSGICRWH